MPIFIIDVNVVIVLCNFIKHINERSKNNSTFKGATPFFNDTLHYPSISSEEIFQLVLFIS